MPLQGRKPFQRIKPPEDLRSNEELFYCKITHEVFREYEEFFDRVILCNSLVWSCSLTGKPGLTFQEAVECEKNARLALKRFPEPLKKPLLYLATLTQRGRLNDMCDDVYAFVKDRYFVHEIVEVTLNGIKKLCEVTKVISPEKEVKSPSKQESKVKRIAKVSPEKLKYEVKEKEHGKTNIVKGQCISRPKSVYTKANNKLFLRHHTCSEDGVFVVKDSATAKYDLANFSFKDVYSGPPPKYSASPTKKKAATNSSSSASSSEKKKLSNGLQESSGKKAVQSKINFKKDEEERTKQLQKEQLEFEKKRKILEEQRAKRKEEIRKRLEEDKERQRALKLKEKEKKKEEKKKLAEYLSLWKKPRDDLECDDLKDLPKPCPVDCSIPQNCFGDAMAVLQFLGTYGNLLKMKDSFPHGFTFDHLERALQETDIQGCFDDLIQMLLTSVFRYSESEEEKMNNRKFDYPELQTGMTLRDAEKVANDARVWPKLCHGTSLHNMLLDSFSITEILRLHILSSGSEKDLTYAQGSHGFSEDPGLQFKLDEYDLVQKLSTISIFELDCEERLKILNLLIQQLLSCDTFRNHIDEHIDKSRQFSLELKQHRIAYARQKRYKTDPGNPKKKDDREDNKSPEEQPVENEVEKAEEEKLTPEEQKALKEKLTPEEQKALKEQRLKDKAKQKSDFLRKEREILAKIQKLSCHQAMPIGLDRAHRRYWLFSSVPGIFVEDDPRNLGPCLSKETPQIPQNAVANNRPENPSNIKKFLHHLSESKNGSSDKENDILQDLAIIQSDFSVPLKGRKLSDLNTRVDSKKPILECSAQETCLQCREKKVEFEGGMPWYCPHGKTSSVYGLCTASIDTCPVHNLNAPRTTWSFFYKPEDFETLLSSLNSRGFREGSLKEFLVGQKDSLLELLPRCPYNVLNKTLPPPPVPEVRKSQRYSSARKSEYSNMKPYVALELTLRDMILELENRIHVGGLGCLKVKDPESWRQKVEENVCSSLDEADLKPKERVEHMSKIVKDLAIALLNISDGVETKYLQSPLSSNGISKLKKWQESLMQCTSLSQLYVHLGTLEYSIAWSRSVLKAQCRICRRKGDAENMLLCDGCNRGHHLYCLKPPLEKIPEGDWFCLNCKPPEKVVSPKKKRVDYKEVSSEEEEEEKDESDDGVIEAEDEESEDEDQAAEDGGEDDEEISEMVDEKCESCGGTGTVICCDKCPKLYHPECIGLKRIPRGEWLCPVCIKAMEVIKKTQKHSPTGIYSTRAQSILDKANVTPKPKIQIKATKRKGSDSSDSDAHASSTPPAKRRQAAKRKRSDSSDSDAHSSSLSRGKGGHQEKDLRKENPFKKVYRNSVVNISRRRSKSLGATDMLDYKTCLDLLVELMHHPSGWPFLVPVSKKDAPDYHLIIKRPMDFGTIKSKLNNMVYKHNDDFVRDLFLVLQNCEMFNPEWTAEYKAARTLHKVVLKLLKEYDILHSIPDLEFPSD